jgi:hypothetical protein
MSLVGKVAVGAVNVSGSNILRVVSLAFVAVSVLVLIASVAANLIFGATFSKYAVASGVNAGLAIGLLLYNLFFGIGPLVTPEYVEEATQLAGAFINPASAPDPTTAAVMGMARAALI